MSRSWQGGSRRGVSLFDVAMRLAALLLVSPYCSARSLTDAQALYQNHCASCHGIDRLGGLGPALLPENLERLKRSAAQAVILQGRHATRMPAFEQSLSPEDASALVNLIYTPLVAPRWAAEDIEASRVVHQAGRVSVGKPVHDADPLNLFVVVEAGDHHITVLDGDKLEPIARLPTRYALHGGIKFSPDGRYAYLASRDGWINKVDLWTLTLVAEVRAGINTRNIALSGNGRYVAVGNYLPHTLVILDAADLALEKVIPVIAKSGKSSRVSAVYDAAPRRSFVVALKDVPELWELSYDPAAEAVYEGMVHDYRMQEGIATPALLTPRRTQLEQVLDDFFFAPGYAYLVGAQRDGEGDQVKGAVVNLDVRRVIANVDLPGLPHLASGIHWERNGTTVMATPNLKRAVISVIDVKKWTKVADIDTPGPGFFLRSHENSPFAWVDAFNSTNKDTLAVIDKQTLEVVRLLRPEPGKTVAHVEFTRDARHALVSLWEEDGAIIVYDARSLEEVKRIPMRKPVGKYNAYNKINRSSGTSH